MRMHRPTPFVGAPRVSVVIPCYRYGVYLPAAVASALDQADLDVDVLIVDDASPDDSAKVAEELASADPRVDVLVHEENAGHIRTYNDGLAKATGDYLVLLSADDLLPRNSLTRAVALMEAQPSVGMVYGWPQNFEDVAPPASTAMETWTVWDGEAWLRAVVRRGDNPIMSPEVVMRRSAWEAAGPFDPRLPHSADLALWLAAAAFADVGRVNGPPQAYYRVHGSNMHLTTYAGWQVDLQERLRTFEIALAEGDARPADAERLLSRARRSLAAEALRRAETAPPEVRDPLVELARTIAGDVSLSPRASVPRWLALHRRARASLAWHRWRRLGW